MKVVAKRHAMDAIQWTGSNAEELYLFTGGKSCPSEVTRNRPHEERVLVIHYMEDVTISCKVGWWVMKPPCIQVVPPDVFDEEYMAI
jgi:hypothetical protein